MYKVTYVQGCVHIYLKSCLYIAANKEMENVRSCHIWSCSTPGRAGACVRLKLPLRPALEQVLETGQIFCRSTGLCLPTRVWAHEVIPMPWCNIAYTASNLVHPLPKPDPQFTVILTPM